MTEIPPEFNSFYYSVYGERWHSLKAALMKPNFFGARLNSFLEKDEKKRLLMNFPLWKPYIKSPETFILEQGDFVNPVDLAGFSVCPYYVMDPASVITASFLNLKDGEKILDLCAAPGGKAIILCQDMGERSHIYLNEYSYKRYERLQRNISQYIPAKVIERVFFSRKDAALFAKTSRENNFDVVLADVPCSSERHLMHGKGNISDWKASRSKKLAYKQFAILAAGFDALKPGGRIIYSTCSISPYENDAVVAKILKKRNNASIIVAEMKAAEKTEFGNIILPDTGDGLGPMYIAQISKNY